MNQKLSVRIFRHYQLYLFLLLPVVYLVIFAYIPILGVQIAFKKFDPTLGIWGSPWCGLHYFIKFFESYQFGRVLTNTLTVSVYGLAAGFPIPILFALLLNAMRCGRYRKIIQTTTYIPHFISTVVMVGMILQVLNPQIGLWGHLCRMLGFDKPSDPMSLPGAFSSIYVWSGIWQTMGWNTIIYISALASSDMELHEAMQIDGASRFQRVVHLDLPSILPTATILLILNAGQIMNVGFEKVMLMQNNMNLSASEVISTYVYKIGLAGASGDFSYGAAIGLFNSLINFILLLLVNTVSRRNEGASLW